MFDIHRACDSKARGKNRYTRKELIDLANRYDIVLPKKNMSISEICNFYKTLDWSVFKEKTPMDIKKKQIKKIQEMTPEERRENMKAVKELLTSKVLEKKLKERRKKVVDEETRRKRIEYRRKRERIKNAENRRKFFEKLDREINDKKKNKEEIESKMASNCLRRCNKRLREYQLRIVRFMQTNNRLLVYHKMGTGKTLTAVTVSQCYLERNPNNRVIVVTPASLSDNFRKGMMEYKYIKHADRYEFYSIQKATNLLKSGELSCKNSLVIIDEVHNYRARIKFKRDELKSGKNIFHGYKCFLRAEKLLLLTGTPLYNNPHDMNVYKVLLNYNKDEFNSKSIREIVKHYSKFDMDSLRCKVSFHDFEKNDSDFPKRIDDFKHIAMTPEYESRYQKIIREIEDKEEKTLLNAVFSNYSESNTNQFENILRRATQNIDNNLRLNDKLNKVVKYINKIKRLNESLPSNEKWKVVIYSQFKKHGINLIRDMIDVPHAIISGDTKVSNRQDIVNAYNRGHIQCLFITKAGGEGLDLKGTDAIILMEPTWNEQNNEQIIGRAIRYKSHDARPEERKKVRVIHLIHTTTDDRKEETKEIIKRFLNQTLDKIPKLPNVLESCDLMLSIFQKAKQRVLNYYDNELRKLSIERNEC